MDINREITLIVALGKEFSSEWIAALFLPIFGEKNYYYECEVGEKDGIFSILFMANALIFHIRTLYDDYGNYKRNTARRFNKVLIIGLGQIGFAVASYIKKQEEYDVYGYDISPSARDRAELKIGIKNAADFTGFDIYMVCISTHNRDDMFTPDTSGLITVANKLSQEGKEGALVVIESTVPQGTSRQFCETVGHKLHVVHAPHRWYAVEENDHGVNQPRVIGGVHDCCLKLGMEFFSGTDSVNGNPKTYNGLGVPMYAAIQNRTSRVDQNN